MKTVFVIKKKKYILKYERKMPEKEVLKMKSFVTLPLKILYTQLPISLM